MQFQIPKQHSANSTTYYDTTPQGTSTSSFPLNIQRNMRDAERQGLRFSTQNPNRSSRLQQQLNYDHNDINGLHLQHRSSAQPLLVAPPPLSVPSLNPQHQRNPNNHQRNPNNMVNNHLQQQTKKQNPKLSKF